MNKRDLQRIFYIEAKKKSSLDISKALSEFIYSNSCRFIYIYELLLKMEGE